MKKFKFGTNFAVFILFFGVALVETFQKQNYLEAILFLALGAISLWGDFKND